jgi:hypothetical protein
MRHPLPYRPRRGLALVATLGLLLLAGALLAGSFVSSLGLRRATTGLTAVARADWAQRRALADALAGWDAAADSLPLGAAMDRPVVVSRTGGPAVHVHARLRHLTPAIYSVTVAVRVGDGAVPMATRRVRLLLARPAGGDSAAGSRVPSPLARWSMSDLP